MSFMDKMHPGGNSRDTRMLAVYRHLKAVASRIVRERTKGLTLTPVNLRGIMFQTSGNDQKLDFNNIGIIEKMRSFGGDDGKAIVFASAYTTIAAALADLPASGGVVYLPPSYTETITASIVIPYDNIAIICPTCDAVITDGDASGIIMLDGGAGQDDITIYGIEFKGKGSGKTSTGIRVGATGSSYRWRIGRCIFDDCKYPIYEGSASYALLNSVIEHCEIRGYALYAFYLTNSRFCTLRDCFLPTGGTVTKFLYVTGQGYEGLRVEDCYVAATSQHAFDIRPSVISRMPAVLIGCVGTVVAAGFSAFLLYPSVVMPVPVKYIGCTAYLNKGSGFSAAGSGAGKARASYVVCDAIDNSYLSANTYPGFRVGAACDRVQLLDCVGIKSARAEQKYGLEIIAGATKTEVRGGVWEPNQTGSYLNGGTDSIIKIRPD